MPELKRPEVFLGVLVLALAAFVAREAMRAPRRVVAETASGTGAGARRDASAPSAPAPRARFGSRADAPHERVDMRFTASAAPSPSELEDTRRRLRLGSPGTWMDDVLRERDSLLLRWRPRDTEPLRVWLAPATRTRDGRREFDAAVREAFTAWSAAGAPVRVTWVPDSASADVPITWIEGFADDRVGATRVRGTDGELTAGAIVLATHTRTGRALETAWIRAIALHEVGHLLGLPHAASDTASIMRPEAALRGLSRGDRGTVRLLYLLPFGSVRSPAKP